MKKLSLILVISTITCAPILGQSIQSYFLGISPQGGYLGVTLKEVSSGDVARLGLPEESGAIIEQVLPDTPAEDAGLQASDVILRYAGQKVLSATQFRRLVSETPPGRNVEMTVWRNGSELVRTVEIDTRKGTHSRYHIPGHRAGDILENFDIEIPEFHLERGDQNIFVLRSPARLGISGESLTSQMAEFLGMAGKSGVLVMEVLDDSPAAAAGLKAGDVIVSCDGEEIGGISALRSHLSEGEHSLTIVRGGIRQTLSVTIPGKDSRKEGKSSSIRL